jgi:tetratricopeptide (TPR) repeat protein
MIAMQRFLLCAATLSWCLVGGIPARAGLYNTAEPMDGPQKTGAVVKPLSFSHFQDVLTRLISIGMDRPTGAERAHYLARRDELQAKLRTGTITVEERINLSAYLTRLRQYEEAVEALAPLAAQERGNFMLLANLGTAHQLAGRLDRGLAFLQQAADVSPPQSPRFTQDQIDCYRRAEKYHLILLKSRYRAVGARSKALDTLDPLFGNVRFIGESGQYEAGKIAAKEREQLPKDALAVVQQLVLWLPDDTRLYWLLGELYNAEGDIAAAAKVFEDCVWSRRFDAAELRAHRQVVQEAKPKAQPLVLEPEEPKPAETKPSWLPDSRKLMLVGVAAGVIVVGLAYLQVREVRKRRQRR